MLCMRFMYVSAEIFFGNFVFVYLMVNWLHLRYAYTYIHILVAHFRR